MTALEKGLAGGSTGLRIVENIGYEEGDDSGTLQQDAGFRTPFLAGHFDDTGNGHGGEADSLGKQRHDKTV
ncbi:MAG: hypothetical protein ABSB49_06655 [Polyangia bacterium]